LDAIQATVSFIQQHFDTIKGIMIDSVFALLQVDTLTFSWCRSSLGRSHNSRARFFTPNPIKATSETLGCSESGSRQCGGRLGKLTAKKKAFILESGFDLLQCLKTTKHLCPSR
jgi:hypothetical protein